MTRIHQTNSSSSYLDFKLPFVNVDCEWSVLEKQYKCGKHCKLIRTCWEYVKWSFYVFGDEKL